MKRPVIAMLLSALILPGLGQLYLGRRIKGVALVMAVNLLLMISLFFVMKIASPIVGAHLTGTPLTPTLIFEVLQPYATWAKVLLAAYLGLWGYGVVDLFSAFREGGDAPRN
jgi:TM2 domain-containing membrane protein YozV